MTEKIMTQHPEGKAGVNIDKGKYEAVRGAIVDTLREHGGEFPFGQLADSVGERLSDFDGSVGWYTTTVKLDLEARDVLERVANVSPQRLRLVQSK